jgi:hypothetical protein
MMQTLPQVRQAEESLVAYLRWSVKNYYLDRIRQNKKLPPAVGDLTDLPDDSLE